LTRLNIASAYFFNGISFLAVIVSLCLIRVTVTPGATHARGSMLHSLQEGLVYVWSSWLLRCLYAIVALTVFLIFPPMAVLSPAYSIKVLHMGPGAIGLLGSVSGAASMFGAVGMLWIPERRRGEVMAASIIASAVALMTMGIYQSLWCAAVATGFLSLGFSLFMGLNQTIVQQIVPNHLRGRVGSVSMMMFNGTLPFAGLLLSFL